MGKIILITGVTRGLGRVMAVEFARTGHTIIGCARSHEAIETMRAEFGQPHNFQVVDVVSQGAVTGWAENVLKRYEAPHLLLNNAAVINRAAPLWEVSPDAFSELIDININGVVNVIRAFLPAMIKAGRGVVMNFSSYWGRSAAAEVAPYCASKWAIEGLTRALASELPIGLAAVALNPGIINTDMLQTVFGSHAAAYADPKDWVKQAVPFLLNLNEMHNGQSLTVSN